MKRKYEFTGETKVVDGTTLHQIRALRDFGDVKAGDVGGWVESEINLSHDGNCWLSDNAVASGNSRISGDVWILRNVQVSGNMRISGSVRINGNVRLSGNAWLCGYARISGYTRVFGND